MLFCIFVFALSSLCCTFKCLCIVCIEMSVVIFVAPYKHRVLLLLLMLSLSLHIVMWQIWAIIRKGG